MKRFSKVLAVALTLFTLCIAPLSAEDGDRIVITSNIPQVEPVFGIKGSLNGADSWVVGTQDGAEIHCNVDITQKPVGVNVLNAYFKVFQANQSRFKGKYRISVTATPFVNTDTGMEGYKTDAPSWFYNGHPTETVGLEITPNTTETSGVGSYDGVTVTYTTGSPVAQGTELFTIAYGWKYKEDLPAGPYKATVTLSFSAL